MNKLAEEDEGDVQNEVEMEEKGLLERIQLNEFPSYHYLRHHAALCTRKHGSIATMSAQVLEHNNGGIRIDTEFTDHKFLSGAVLGRQIFRSSVGSWLMGTPYTYLDGGAIAHVPVESRLTYYAESARNQQLLFPGAKLQRLIDPSGPNKSLAKYLNTYFIPNAFPERSATPAVPYRVSSTNKKLMQYSIDGVMKEHFTVEAVQSALEYARNDKIEQSWNEGDKIRQSLREILQVNDESPEVTLNRYHCIRTRHYTIWPGMNLALEGGNSEIWYCRLLAIYAAEQNKEHEEEDTSVSEDSVALIIMYYEQRHVNHPVYNFPELYPFSIDVAPLNSIVRLQHILRPLDLHEKVNEQLHLNIPIDAKDHDYWYILNLHAKFPAIHASA